MGADAGSFRQLFDSAPDGIFVASPDGRYTDVNAAGCRLLGCTREDLIGRSVTEFVAPAELARQAALTRRLLEGGAEVSEWRLRRLDGTYVPVELSATVLPDGNLLGFVRDINERLQTDEALRLSEAKFAGIVSISADAIVTIDDAGRISLFNEGAQHVFGYAKEEIIGAPLEVLIPERFRGAHRGHVRGLAAGPDTARLMGAREAALFGRRKNGDEFPLEASISKVTVRGKHVFTAILRDISERKWSEDEQRVLAEIGRIIVGAGPDCKRLLTEVADAIVHHIADWCSLNIVQEGDVQRQRVVHADITKAETCAAFERRPLRRADNPVFEAADRQRPTLVSNVTPEYLEAIAEDGEHLRLLRALDPGSFVVVPLVARGRAVGTLALGSSGTSRRYDARDLARAERLAERLALAVDNARLHEALEIALRARDDVLGIVAHDLRNPLNAMLMNLQLLRRRPSGQEPREERAIDAIRRGVVFMNRLVQDLLDVARVEGGQRLSIDRSLVQPLTVVGEVVEEQRAAIREAERTLTVDVPAVSPDVWADGGRLAQVLNNLLGNAIKFSRRHITVGIAAQDGEVRFWVADDGLGIAECDRQRLFDRFWQAAKADRRGAGLGLSIVKGIVEAHGGRIWVDSTVGVGTTFYFTMPVGPGTPQPG